MGNWSYITGKRGLSRVRVYERRPDGPLHVEWYPHGKRKQRSLKYFTGEPIYEKSDAMRIADAMAKRLERGRARELRTALFGVDPHKTLEQLLARLHKARAPRWSKTYTRDQERFRRFWIRALGPDIKVIQVSASMVEEVAAREAEERDWSPRTEGSYLRYMVDAFLFAQQKLKWIEPRHNLSAVDIPDPDSRSRAYSTDEVRRLLDALAEIDPRAEWLGHVLWQTGRRLTAARTLPSGAVEVREDYSVILWPRDTDKARKRETVSVVTDRAHELTVQLLRRGGRYVTGAEPVPLATAQGWMLRAEEIAEVPHQDYRLWHGIKRRYSDRTEGMKSRAAQANTTEEMLRKRYDPRDDLDAMLEVAKTLAREVSGE